MGDSFYRSKDPTNEAMADDRFKQEIVTTFLLCTCVTCQRMNLNSFISSLGCLAIANSPHTDETCCSIPLSTGSAAEFYIQPILSCVGDFDIMFHLTNQLAVPAGTAPPTQLPGDFDSVVRVFEIIDDNTFPGYVYLKSSYILTECTEGKYIAERCERKFASKFVDMPRITFVPKQLKLSVMHGPARVNVYRALPPILRRQRRISGPSLSIDQVYCVRCLSWPTQAAQWPTRHRIHGWPDSATIVRVVSEGCDVVQVAHRQCRQHEWMSRHQHRLSFSRAEIILLNSWMPVQQIVYHILRVFVKTERLTDSAGDSEAKVLSNYHIKTLMLWACELKPRSWWIDDLNVVRIGVQLLRTLAAWLTDARCQHYFVNNCNLFDHFDNWQLIANRLTSETEASLAEWFIGEYIRKTAAELCPKHILRLFEDTTKVQNAVSEVVNCRLERLSDAKAEDLYTVQYVFAFIVSSFFPLSKALLQSCILMMRRYANIDQHVYLYFTASTFLHAAYKTTKDQLTDELLDILSITCLQSSERRRCLNARHSSVLSLSQAAKLMKVVANNSCSTVQLIEIELSKAYLHRALRCKDSDSDSIYCLANVYLAVLYYTTGQYQTAIDHCTLVTRSEDHSQCSSRVVQGELLPKIDDNVDSVLGLATLYHYVQTAAFNQQQQHHVSVFTTDLFAHYLHIKCLSVGNNHQLTQPSLSADDIQRYKKRFFCEFNYMFITDVLLYHLENGQIQTIHKYSVETATAHKLDTPELVQLLQRSAVEHLTRFRHFTAQVFESEAVTAKTDFEALYAYKRGDYQRCLRLSVDVVRTLIGQSTFLHACLFATPEFIQLMDDDIASLAGLALIVNPWYRHDDVEHFAISQLSLLLYLMTQCQLRLHHSPTALAQTFYHAQVVRRRSYDHVVHMRHWYLDKLLLKLTERKILIYISAQSSSIA